MIRKIIYMFVLVFSLSLLTLISGCSTSSNTEEYKVMTISVNPELEFILDEENVVVVVNALNEDGNILLDSVIENEETFEGVGSEEAVDLFLEFVDKDGFLVSQDDQAVTIGISGNHKKLKNKLVNRVNKFLEEKDIELDVNLKSIAKKDILDKVKDCMREYDENDLSNMSEQKLIDLLKESRKETSSLLNQELKEVYYSLRGKKIDIAELEHLLEIVNASMVENEEIESFKNNMDVLTTKLEELEDIYALYFVEEESEYQVALNLYFELKNTLLNMRLEFSKDHMISDEEKSLLEACEAEVLEAKENLDLIIESCKEEISLLEEEIKELIAELCESVDVIKSLVTVVDKKEDIVQHIKDNYLNEFRYKNKFEHNDKKWGKNVYLIANEEELLEALDECLDGAIIRLKNNVVISEQLSISKRIALDLGGFSISNVEDIWDTENKKWSLVSVIDGGDLTIRNGSLLAKENDCYAIDVRDGSKLTVESGRYVGNVSSIYVYEGEAVIKGGEFDILQLSSSNDSRYTLNCYDQNYQTGVASIIISGGKFANYNPEESISESSDANFLREPLTITTMNIGGDVWYIVIPKLPF